MPALFPNTGEHITIKQGAVGDCYLLASLECLFRANIDLIKKRFSILDDGRIQICLKHSDLSKNLRADKLAGKYAYRFDVKNNSDVFILSEQQLEEIIVSQEGATTNSFAASHGEPKARASSPW